MSDQEYVFDEELHEQRRLRRLELKRKRQIRQRITYAVLLCLLILVIVLISKGCQARTAAEEEQARLEAEQQAAQEALLQQQQQQQQQSQPITATLAAVGDIMVYDEQLQDALQQDGSYNFLPSFSKVAAFLTEPDYTVGNFEANCIGAPYAGYPDFNAPESLAKTLSAVGFDLMQTANTYSIQNGVTGLESTLDNLKAGGLDTVGTYAAKEDKETSGGVVIKDIGGIKVAFLAFTKGVNNMSLPVGYEYCVNLLYTDYNSTYSKVNEAGILTSIESAKALSPDIIVAMVHWGSEYETAISDTQKEIADLMVKNGVDVILGSHPHVVGQMEERTVTIDDVEKKVFIAYSLGNFISNMTEDEHAGTQESVILNLEFTKNPETAETVISKIEYIPLYIWDNGEEAANRYEVVSISEAMKTETDAERLTILQTALRSLAQSTKSAYARP